MSLDKLHEHRVQWASKPVLAEIYAVWFRELASLAGPGDRVLEIGAGPGLFAEWARRERPDLRWIATDLLPAPWNDLAADACALPLATGAVDLVVGLDVLHHLARPQDFFREVARITRPGGRLALMEPWVTPLSYPIYRFAHQEGCTLGIDPWRPFADGPKEAFDGDGALAWRIVRDASPADWAGLGLARPQVTTANGFAYLLSLGFKPASLLPRACVGPLLWLDQATRALSRLTGLRARIVWERRGTGV